MTIEQYIKSVLRENPAFVAAMNARIKREFSQRIQATQAEFSRRMDEAKKAWIANKGEQTYKENEKAIREYIAVSIPRHAAIKKITLNGDVFEVDIDLLTGLWTIAPV